MRLGNCDAAYPESISLLPLQLCAFSRSSSQPKLGPASVVPHHVRYASRYKGTGSCHSKTASCTATTERAQKSCMAVLCDSRCRLDISKVPLGTNIFAFILTVLTTTWTIIFITSIVGWTIAALDIILYRSVGGSVRSVAQ